MKNIEINLTSNLFTHTSIVPEDKAEQVLTDLRDYFHKYADKDDELKVTTKIIE
jgi:hypothetical protein